MGSMSGDSGKLAVLSNRTYYSPGIVSIAGLNVPKDEFPGYGSAGNSSPQIRTSFSANSRILSRGDPVIKLFSYVFEVIDELSVRFPAEVWSMCRGAPVDNVLR
jgi:hypothetical protein